MPQKHKGDRTFVGSRIPTSDFMRLERLSEVTQVSRSELLAHALASYLGNGSDVSLDEATEMSQRGRDVEREISELRKQVAQVEAERDGALQRAHRAEKKFGGDPALEQDLDESVASEILEHVRNLRSQLEVVVSRLPKRANADPAESNPLHELK